MQEVWDEHQMEEEWGVLLINASNAFNEKERKGMLWTVQHEWPSGARFLFNVYRYHSVLVIRNNNGIGVFILSKEGNSRLPSRDGWIWSWCSSCHSAA
jgi:hypothetical protein